MFFFGELGLLGGSASAQRTITRDPESRQRIEAAFRMFRAEVLKKEVSKLETGEGQWGVRL